MKPFKILSCAVILLAIVVFGGDASARYLDVADYGLDSWGNLKCELPTTTDNRTTFTDHQYGLDTGLHYFKARYYDSEIGRFITQDQYLGDPSQPQSLNRYTYAYNNPTVYTDPSGNCVWDGCIVETIGAVMAAEYLYNVGYQMIAEDKKISEVNHLRAATFGMSMGGVAMGVATGNPYMLMGMGGGGAFDVWGQSVMNPNRSINYEQTMTSMGMSAWFAAALPATQPAMLGVDKFAYYVSNALMAGLSGYGAYQGTSVAINGYESGNNGQVAYGTVLAALSGLGMYTSAKAFVTPEVIAAARGFTGGARNFLADKRAEWSPSFSLNSKPRPAVQSGAAGYVMETVEVAPGVRMPASGSGLAGRSNAQLVQEIATRAEIWGVRQGVPVAGSGPVQGTLKHSYAQRLLERYQSIYGNRGLQTEASYLKGQAVPYGTKGGVRLDVLEPSTGCVWDYKFTQNPSLPASRIQRIINNGPVGISSVEAVGP
jgi:RHS repeat-associated protein